MQGRGQSFGLRAGHNGRLQKVIIQCNSTVTVMYSWDDLSNLVLEFRGIYSPVPAPLDGTLCPRAKPQLKQQK